MKKIVLVFFMLAISLDLNAKEYSDMNITQDNGMYYDSNKNPLTGTVVSQDHTVITNVKNGKLHGDVLLYHEGVLRGKSTFKDGKLRVQETYWPNKKLRTRRPIVAHYVNGQLVEKYKEEPTRGYYKNGKLMFEQTKKETIFYDKNGKPLAQFTNGNANKSFCFKNGQKKRLSEEQIEIFTKEFDRIIENTMDEQEADFSQFKCESPEKVLQELTKKQNTNKNTKK